MNNDERNCPACGETIKALAIKCKHCKSDIQNKTSSIKTNDEKIQVSNIENSMFSAKEIFFTFVIPIFAISLNFHKLNSTNKHERC